MPRKTGISKKPKLIARQKPIASPEELEEFIREANEVQTLTSHAGWGILSRDLNLLKDSVVSRLAYLNPKRPEFYEARLLYIAIDKIFALVEDYRTNKDSAFELLNKIQNPDLTVTMDIDNEI